MQFCPRPTSIYSPLQPEAIYKIIIVKRLLCPILTCLCPVGRKTCYSHEDIILLQETTLNFTIRAINFQSIYFCVRLWSLPHSFLECVILYETESLEIITQLLKSTSVKLQYPQHHHYISLTTKHISRSFRVDGGVQEANYNDLQEAGKTESNTSVLDLYFWGIY